MTEFRRRNHRGNTETSQCMGKDGFDSFAGAQTVLTRMRHSRTTGPPAVIYRCDFCHLWHIGRKR